MIYFARILALFVAIPIHEFAHGYMSNRLGDPTARYEGRLSLNPLDHLDPIGAMLIIFTGFGWAKPVQINSRYYKNAQNGVAITALAGPVANILLAFVILIIAKVFIQISMMMGITQSSLFSNINFVFSVMINVNITMGVFNLLPIPPLDGFKVFSRFMPHELVYKLNEYQYQLTWVIMFVLAFTNILTVPITFLSNVIYNVMNLLTSFIY